MELRNVCVLVDLREDESVCVCVMRERGLGWE